MKYKPDWSEAQERLTALWHGGGVISRFASCAGDAATQCRGYSTSGTRRGNAARPCVAVKAPSGNSTPCPPPATPEQKWLDPEWLVDAAKAGIENTWWGGEAIPSYLVMSGWLVSFGATPRFAMDTIWWEEMSFDFEQPPELSFDPDDQWVARFSAAYLAMAEFAGKDDFLIGQPCILPANDLLSMLMGTGKFLMNLIDHPEWMRAAIMQGAEAQVAACNYFKDRIQDHHDYWYGNGGWMTFWAPEPYHSTQSDVSCMLSPEMFDQFILPELEILHNAFGPLWYHLDGGDARQHLPRLLSLPYLRVLQYTPAPFEPVNGPEHLDFYRTVQNAGKIVHIQLPKENVEPLLKALDPALLMLDTYCRTVEEGEALLAAAERWC